MLPERASCLVLEILSIIAICADAFFFFASTVGLLRFPDALTRLHTLTKADNLGLGLVVLGLLPRTGSLLDSLKLVAIWALIQLAGATAGQLIARATRRIAVGVASGSRRLAVYNPPRELVRIFRRFDRRSAGCVEEFMDNEQEPCRQAETPTQPADLVTMMERPRNRRPVFALASWTAERRAKGWYIRKTDHGGGWRGPYSTIASVSLMIAREFAKELAKRGGFASRD